MNYYLYTPFSYTFRAQIKKTLKQLNVDYKNIVWQKYWSDTLERNPQMGLDLSATILILENKYLKEPLCVLPETHHLVEQILDTNFEGQVTTLKPVAEMFSIAVPKEKRFNGQVIEGIFVGYTTNRRFDEDQAAFNLQHGTTIKTVLVPVAGKDDPILTIAYSDPQSPELIVLTSLVSRYEKILSARTATEFKVYAEDGKEPISLELTDDEYQTQFEIVRFVIGFIVYMSAHSDCLCDEQSIKMPASTKDSPKYIVRQARHFKPKGTIKPHYRNLRDERFYRHEWSNWPSGSRWVPVNMETIQVLENDD